MKRTYFVLARFSPTPAMTIIGTVHTQRFARTRVPLAGSLACTVNGRLKLQFAAEVSLVCLQQYLLKIGGFRKNNFVGIVG